MVGLDVMALDINNKIASSGLPDLTVVSEGGNFCLKQYYISAFFA
jgi:hypothetical protein